MTNVDFFAEDKIEKLMSTHTFIICMGIIFTMIFVTIISYHAGKESIKYDRTRQKIQEEINWQGYN